MTKQEELNHHRAEHYKYRDLYNNSRNNRVVESINVNWKQKLYKKVGKKFIEANDVWALNGLREGWWLVGVKAGSTSIRQAVYPARADLQAAAWELEDKIVEIVREANEARPSKTLLSREEKKDWDAFIKKHGESFSTIHYPSFADNAKKIVDAILERVK